MSRPCRTCGLTTHSTTFCYARKRNPILSHKKIKQIGKQGQKWLKTRAEWFVLNPAEYYTCYICGERLTLKETTLDHIKSRTRHPELRYDLSNLAPCCYRCNRLKGSKDLEEMGDIWLERKS